MKKVIQRILRSLLGLVENPSSEIDGTLKSYHSKIKEIDQANGRLTKTRSEIEAQLATLEKTFSEDSEDKDFVESELKEFREFLAEVNKQIELNDRARLKLERGNLKVGFLRDTFDIREKIAKTNLGKSKVALPDFDSDIDRLRK